jgi:hypothetical protein
MTKRYTNSDRNFKLALKFITGTDRPKGNENKTYKGDRNFVLQSIISLT